MGLFKRQPAMPDFTTGRGRMVDEQLRARGISDPRVLEAMRTIPRHEFVPPGLVERAYEDRPLPIGGGQTISQPYIVALMTQLLELDGSERVLEVGAGCGYQTAILSRLATEVCSVELDSALGEEAVRHLGRLGVSNVDFRCGDAFEPWPGGGGFDAILCACAPEAVPRVLIDQLRPGGRLVIPVGPSGEVQQLHRIRMDDGGRFTDEDLGGVRFVPMRDSGSLS